MHDAVDSSGAAVCRIGRYVQYVITQKEGNTQNIDTVVSKKKGHERPKEGRKEL